MIERVANRNKYRFDFIVYFILYAFILILLFVGNWDFVDENDNFLGGMVIANGGLLYRD